MTKKEKRFNDTKTSWPRDIKHKGRGLKRLGCIKLMWSGGEQGLIFQKLVGKFVKLLNKKVIIDSERLGLAQNKAG